MEERDLAATSIARLELLVEAGRWHLAESQIRAVLSMAPADGKAHRLAGEVYLCTGELLKCERHWKEALALRPSSVNRFNFGCLEYQKKNYNRAIEWFESVLAKYPNDGSAWLLLGWAN